MGGKAPAEPSPTLHARMLRRHCPADMHLPRLPAPTEVIKPESGTPALDTSSWPLLLKNYSQLNVRSGHYTPIPSGHTPLRRPLQVRARQAQNEA